MKCTLALQQVVEILLSYNEPIWLSNGAKESSVDLARSRMAGRARRAGDQPLVARLVGSAQALEPARKLAPQRLAHA